MPEPFPEAELPPTHLPGVLVADDDPTVRRVLEAWLSREGFAVWLAEDGAEAVGLYREHREVIDVVLLDVRMPGLNGPQTLEVLRALDPQLKSCFMSGHAGGFTEEELRALGAAHLFAKPFRLDELTEALRQLVGRVEPENAEPA
jgi:CheY-like chemotaxis protein